MVRPARWLLCLSLLTAGRARAEGERSSAPSTRSGEYSPYERKILERALRELGWKLQPNAEGKRIEHIELVRLDVFDQRIVPLADWPVVGGLFEPKVLNALHARSKDWIIRREVMLKPDEPFQQSLLDESSRNLRELAQLSLVIGVAAQGSKPDSVRVLLITKDIWSLRLGSDFSVTAGGLESLTLQPTEINLAGLHHSASVGFDLNPSAYSLSTGYAIPRFGQSYIGASARLAVHINRERGAAEGSTGSLALGQPLYTTLVPWAWELRGGWSDVVKRRFVNAKLARFDAESTAENEQIPFEYRARELAARASVTRSFGWRYKSDFTLAWSLQTRRYLHLAEDTISPAAMSEFRQRYMPRDDSRSTPFIQLRSYTTDYHRIVDFMTLSLQEDYRLGHDIYLRLYPSSRALGSSRDFVGLFASAQYTVPLGDGMARTGFALQLEGHPDKLYDGSLFATLRVVTPRLGFGRVVLDLEAMNRFQNYLNQLTQIGGNSYLRGFPSNYLIGASYVSANLEFRARPFALWTLQIAPSVFFDVADAAQRFSQLSPKQSTGIGLRVLIPQLNRVVLRGDLGFPLLRPLPANISPVGFFFSFGQAFDFASISP